MDWSHITTTCIGLAVSAIAWGVQRWIGIKMSAERRAQLQWALEQGVAAAAVRFVSGQGGEKKELALRTAESLAPKAMKELDAAQKSIVVDATYAKMKASLPNTTFVHHGDALEHQTESLMRPTPMPPYRGPKP